MQVSRQVRLITQVLHSTISGQELIIRKITQPKTTLDISSLPQGIYVVKLTSNKSVATAKLNKQ